MYSSVKIAAFAYRNWIFAQRNVFAFVEIIFWPLVGLLSIGLMSSFLDLKGNLANFIFTGTITSGVLQITQMDVSYSTLYDVWSKSYKHTLLAPITHFHYVFGSWLIGMARGLIVFFLLAVLARRFFHFGMPSFPITAVFLAGVFGTGLVLGMFVCLLILLFGQKVEVTAWSMVSLLMLICGIYYPVSYLPEAIRFISELIPLTYFLDYFRSSYGFEPLFTHDLLKGFAGVVVYAFLLLYCLDLALARARRTGMILRLSE